MAERQPRYNAYAETVAPLVDVRQESMVARPANQQAIEGLLAMLRDVWAANLRRGWYGFISIELEINDGIIEKEVGITNKRTQRLRE
jgi:hypothetical protein